MTRTHAFPATLTALTLAATGMFGTAVCSATPFPGEVIAGGVRVVASVDDNHWLLAGDTALGVPFAHAAKVSGNFSVNMQGARIRGGEIDRKSTRLNSSHVKISYAVFCLKKKRI